MITEINVEWEKSDRLTVAKLNTVKHFNKQDHKSKLMTEKYSLLPLNPQQLTPVQTAIVRHNLTVHCSVTPFIIQQPIQRPHLLKKVYKPMHTSH